MSCICHKISSLGLVAPQLSLSSAKCSAALTGDLVTVSFYACVDQEMVKVSRKLLQDFSLSVSSPFLSLSLLLLLSLSFSFSLLLTCSHSLSLLICTLNSSLKKLPVPSSLSSQLKEAMPLHPNSTSSHCGLQNATGQQAD